MPVGKFSKRLTDLQACSKMVRRRCRVAGPGPRAPGSTDEIDRVMACNECMDVAMGLRTDGGMTCRPCFDVYLDGGCRGRHATIGGEPFTECWRNRPRKDSALVTLWRSWRSCGGSESGNISEVPASVGTTLKLTQISYAQAYDGARLDTTF